MLLALEFTNYLYKHLKETANHLSKCQNYDLIGKVMCPA